MYSFKKVSLGYAPEEVDRHFRSLLDEHNNYANRTRKELSTVTDRITKLTAAISLISAELERHAGSHRRSVELYNEQIAVAENEVKDANQKRQAAILSALARLEMGKNSLAKWQTLVEQAREELLAMRTKYGATCGTGQGGGIGEVL